MTFGLALNIFVPTPLPLCILCSLVLSCHSTLSCMYAVVSPKIKQSGGLLFLPILTGQKGLVNIVTLFQVTKVKNTTAISLQVFVLVLAAGNFFFPMLFLFQNTKAIV